MEPKQDKWPEKKQTNIRPDLVSNHHQVTFYNEGFNEALALCTKIRNAEVGELKAKIAGLEARIEGFRDSLPTAE